MKKKRLFSSFELQLTTHLQTNNRKMSTIKEYKTSIRNLEEYFYQNYIYSYDAKLSDKYRRNLKSHFEKKDISVNTYRSRRRTSIFLDNYYQGRRINLLDREEKPQPEIYRLDFEYKGKKKTTGHDVLPAFSSEELEAILKVPDKLTAEGLRDYAMIVLATFTGMRGCDILNLKISDIDYRNKTISFRQKKTGTLIELPVDQTAISSIREYLKKGRPENCDTDYLFVSHKYPYGKISTMSSIFRPILDKSNIGKTSNDGKGFHSIRRTMGSFLLSSGSRPEMITQVLGHKDPNMFTHYIPLSPNSLSICLMPLGNLKCTKEGLK